MIFDGDVQVEIEVADLIAARRRTLHFFPEVQKDVIDDLFGWLFYMNDGKTKPEQADEIMSV
jgi:hypothetical protein